MQNPYIRSKSSSSQAHINNIQCIICCFFKSSNPKIYVRKSNTSITSIHYRCGKTFISY